MFRKIIIFNIKLTSNIIIIIINIRITTIVNKIKIILIHFGTYFNKKFRPRKDIFLITWIIKLNYIAAGRPFLVGKIEY